MNFDNPMFGEEPEWLAAKQKFMDVLDKHDKPYGGFAFIEPPFGSPEGVKEAAKRMSFITMSSDVTQLMKSSNDANSARELVKLE